MNNHRRSSKLSALLSVGIAAALLFTARAFAESVSVDELPHSVIQLPNGVRAEVIHYNGVNYRVVGSEILNGNSDTDPDVCFEAKFDSITSPHQVKLFGTQGVLIVENTETLKAAADFKRADNVWFCGTLHKSGKSIEFLVADMQKQLPDIERYNRRINLLNKELSKNMPREERMVLSENAIDLGRRIESDMKQSTLGNFGEYDKLGAIRDHAYDVGLESKEKAIKADDAEAYFELAEQWKEYRHKLPKFRELVLKCLKLDPEHARASRVAEEQFGMQKFEGGWIRKEQMDEILKGKADDLKRLEAAKKATAERFARDQEREVAERPAKLSKLQLALCTNDPKRRDGALESASKAINESIDPGFGVQAVDILANLQDHSVIYPALDQASKSQWAPVRREAYEALAWRSVVKDDQVMALKVLTDALKNEKDVATARIGVEALVAANSKPAMGALVASLATAEPAIRDEVVAGLKTATKQTLASKEEWENWWQNNKN